MSGNCSGGKKEEISEEAGAKKVASTPQKEKDATVAAAKKDAEKVTGTGTGTGTGATTGSTAAGTANKTATGASTAAAKEGEKKKSGCCGCVIQ